MDGVVVSTLLALALGFAMLWFVARFVVRVFRPVRGNVKVCRDCGHHGPTKQHTRGTMGLEIALWLLFLLPGIVYSVWRLTTRKQVCESCGGVALVSATSPAGRKLLTTREAAPAPVPAARARA